MRIFTCSRNSSESPERRVPVISAPFGFQHGNHSSPDAEMISASIGFQHVQHASVGATTIPISAPIGLQHVQHGNLGGEMQSISQVINTRAAAMSPSGRDLNRSVPSPAMKAPPVPRAPIQSDNTMTKFIHRKTHIHGMGLTPIMTGPAPKSLRSVFSTPELRDSDIPQNIARLRPVRSRQSESGTSRRRSWFSVTTEIIEGRRTLIRKVLDTLGCTKGDRFDIQDFEPVKPRAPTVVQAFRSTEREFTPAPRRPSSLSWGETRGAPNNAVTRAR